jgi:hypothetical protein
MRRLTLNLTQIHPTVHGCDSGAKQERWPIEWLAGHQVAEEQTGEDGQGEVGGNDGFAVSFRSDLPHSPGEQPTHNTHCGQKDG